MQDNVNGSDIEKFYVIEQKNLLQLLKLSIKNFIDFALSLTSGLEEEEGSLYQLFVVLEQVNQQKRNSLDAVIMLIANFLQAQIFSQDFCLGMRIIASAELCNLHDLLE